MITTADTGTHVELLLADELMGTPRRNSMRRARLRRWAAGLAFAAGSLLGASAVGAQEIDRRAQPVTFGIETGPLLPGTSDVGVPGDGGTRFSLTETLSANAAAYVRLETSVTIAGRHTILLRMAPVSFTSEGTAPFPIAFNGTTFAAGTHLDTRFRFDTYRASYRFGFVENERLEIAGGATLLVRDASIRLFGGGREEVKKNIGVVPLLSGRFAWSFAPPFAVVVDADALVAPQGRAEDVLVALRVTVARPLRTYVGYRLIEGGADNDEVYNFNLLHFVAVGAELAF